MLTTGSEPARQTASRTRAAPGGQVTPNRVHTTTFIPAAVSEPSLLLARCLTCTQGEVAIVVVVVVVVL